MTTKELNRDTVTGIAKKSETASAVFTVLGARERARTEVDLRRLKNELVSEGFKVVPTEFSSVFKDLANAGIGTMRKEKGKPDRFQFHYNPIEVGKMGVNTSDEPEAPVKPAAPAPAKAPIKAKVAKSNKEAAKSVSPARMLFVVLAEDRHVKIDLPEGLTCREARLLADTILNKAGS